MRFEPVIRSCLPKENPIHALLRGPQHRYCRDQVCKFLGSVAIQISSTIIRALKSALANRRLTIWGPNPANPCGRLIKLEVLPENLDRVEIAGPMTARAEKIKPRSFAEADCPSDRLVGDDRRAEASLCAGRQPAGDARRSQRASLPIRAGGRRNSPPCMIR